MKRKNSNVLSDLSTLQFQNAWMKLFGMQRDETDPQTGLTASVAATVSAVPINAKTEALNTSTTPAERHLFPGETMRENIAQTNNPLEESVTPATAAALTNPIIERNKVNSNSADATALELHTIVLHETDDSDDDRQCEKISANNDVTQS